MDKKTYHIIQLLFKYYRETLSVSEKVERLGWQKTNVIGNC